MKNSYVYRNPKYFLSLLPGIAVISGNMMGGWWGISNVVFSLVILALLEWFAPVDMSNETGSESIIPDIVLILHICIQVFALSTFFFSIQQNKFSFWRWLGKFLLFTAGNVYFFVEHLRVHHKWVGTEKDPASAYYNESLYRFYLRTTLNITDYAEMKMNE